TISDIFHFNWTSYNGLLPVFNRVKYYKIKRKYYYDYLMVDLVKYNQWVQKTSYSALFYGVFSFFQKNVTRKLIKK
ncbi:hypothetical protein ACJOMQ_04030, partial [Mycoplasmopsis synoviae]